MSDADWDYTVYEIPITLSTGEPIAGKFRRGWEVTHLPTGLCARSDFAYTDLANRQLGRSMVLAGLKTLGIRCVCPLCDGRGVRSYANTGTWLSELRSGMICGQAMTEDVCSRCWGSGDEADKGEDLYRRWKELHGES